MRAKIFDIFANGGWFHEIPILVWVRILIWVGNKPRLRSILVCIWITISIHFSFWCKKRGFCYGYVRGNVALLRRSWRWRPNCRGFLQIFPLGYVHLLSSILLFENELFLGLGTFKSQDLECFLSCTGSQDVMFQLRIAALVSILSLLDINIKVDSSGRQSCLAAQFCGICGSMPNRIQQICIDSPFHRQSQSICSKSSRVPPWSLCWFFVQTSEPQQNQRSNFTVDCGYVEAFRNELENWFRTLQKDNLLYIDNCFIHSGIWFIT